MRPYIIFPVLYNRKPYNLMLNSGEKNILTLVLSEKNFSERNKKPKPSLPPPKLNDRSLTIVIVQRCLAFKKGLSRSLDLD